jgi:hypothetical protein
MTTAVDALRFARAFAAPVPCSNCDDWMIAPVSSEFVAGGEIRHHWQCDACGSLSSTSVDVPLQPEAPVTESCAA